MLRERLLVAAALNLPFLLFQPGAPLIDSAPARALAIGLVLFLVPGLAALGPALARRKAGAASWLWVIAASSLLNAFAAFVLRLGPAAAWNAVWLMTDAALLFWAARRGPSLQPLLPQRRPLAAGLLLFFASYAAYFHAAVSVVPAMEDHDYETQGTAHGLLSSGRPALLTDRGTDFVFAHPPLLHLYVAESFLYWDRLERLVPYGEAWSLARAKAGAREGELQGLYALYRADPAVLPTRTPNVFLAAFTVALLGAWAGALSGRWWLGLLAAAAYASSPETFVRSGYGGYFALGQLAALLLLWNAGGPRSAALLGGAFLALSDHKLLFLPLALAGWEWKEHRRPHPAALGFLGGSALFWSWGLSVDAATFWVEHVRGHLVDRALHVNPLGYGGYPGPLELWSEFARHTGALLLPFGAWALAQEARVAHEARRWALWALLTSAAFTLVDWRQTKHLTPLLLPLLLAPMRRAGRDPSYRLPAAACLALVLAWNLSACVALARDFRSLAVSPAW